MEDERIEILSGNPGVDGAYLDKVYDSKSDTYFIPILDPDLKNLKENLEKDRTKTTTLAILDTGMLFDHPWIKNNLKDSVNFSSDKVEYDLNGHGTLVTLLFLAVSPHSKILNVKVMNKRGKGREKDVINGIKWAVENGANIINISVGLNSKKWGLFDCKGDCKLCNAAKAAANAGVFVVAAAGNEPGMTCCPAKAGLNGYPGIVAVGAYDFENSGVGDVDMPSTVSLTPLNND